MAAGCGLLLAAWGAAAETPRFGLPIRCQPGVDCFIQNYVDQDPGPGWRDYACGFLSYDGHTGTDFRVPDLRAMRRGVAVLAAADGVVAATRDGEPDILVSRRGREVLRGRDAGNGVRIEHGDGWETQYSHLLRGSILVRPGQRVRAGEPLGLVGLSGNTEFPHVDFTIRKDGRPLDPFVPAGAAPGQCQAAKDGLWLPAVAEQLRYQGTGLLVAGFAPGAVSREQVQGEHEIGAVTRDAGALVFWAELFGLRQDDELELVLIAPGGESLVEHRLRLPGNKVVYSAMAGKRRAESPWPAGKYQGRVSLRRGGQTIVSRTQALDVR